MLFPDLLDDILSNIEDSIRRLFADKALFGLCIMLECAVLAEIMFAFRDNRVSHILPGSAADIACKGQVVFLLFAAGCLSRALLAPLGIFQLLFTHLPILSKAGLRTYELAMHSLPSTGAAQCVQQNLGNCICHAYHVHQGAHKALLSQAWVDAGSRLSIECQDLLSHSK